jgi:UDP-N-acetyl-L-fucosamine synthase
VDHIADINLPYSSIAREYLLRVGILADRIIKTGSPMFEVLNYYMPKIEKSDVLKRLKLEKGKYFVVSAHHEENINNEKNFNGLLESLNQIAEKYQYPIIVSTHPRTRKKLEQFKRTTNTKHYTPDKLISWMKPLSFSDYISLQINAYAVLSDSGTISEESSILNFPAITIWQAHERPEAMEEASVMMVGLNPERILQGLVQLQYQKTQGVSNLRTVSDYSMPNVSDKVVRIILSYTAYIKRNVWNEN